MSNSYKGVMPAGISHKLRRGGLKKALAVLTLGIMLLSGGAVPVWALNDGGTGPAGAGASMERFEEALKPVIEDAIKVQLPYIIPGIESVVAGEIDAMAPKIMAVVEARKKTITSLEAGGREEMSKVISSLPPESVIANIPQIVLGEVRASTQEKVRAQIKSQFESIIPSIREQIRAFNESQTPQLMEIVGSSVSSMAPQINKIIEEKIENQIQLEIQLRLPELTPLIPEEMKSLTPEEMALQMRQRLQPYMESRIRPSAEEELKKKVNEAVSAKIEKPVEALMRPRLEAAGNSILEENLAMIPGYVERVVPREFVRSVVKEENGKLESQIPAMILEEVSRMRGDIEAMVDRELKSQIKVYNGETKINFDVAPQIKNDRMLVPFRAIAESLGAKVGWNNESQQVIFQKEGREIILTLDSDTVIVNGETQKIDVAPTVIEDRTMVPVRFLGEYLGMEVQWQPDWQMVTLQ